MLSLLDRLIISGHILLIYLIYKFCCFIYNKIYSYYILIFNISIVLNFINKNDLVEKYVIVTLNDYTVEGKLKSISMYYYEIEYFIIDLNNNNRFIYLSDIYDIQISSKYKDLYNWRMSSISKKIPYDINYEIEKFICYDS